MAKSFSDWKKSGGSAQQPTANTAGLGQPSAGPRSFAQWKGQESPTTAPMISWEDQYQQYVKQYDMQQRAAQSLANTYRNTYEGMKRTNKEASRMTFEPGMEGYATDDMSALQMNTNPNYGKRVSDEDLAEKYRQWQEAEAKANEAKSVGDYWKSMYKFHNDADKVVADYDKRIAAMEADPNLKREASVAGSGNKDIEALKAERDAFIQTNTQYKNAAEDYAVLMAWNAGNKGTVASYEAAKSAYDTAEADLQALYADRKSKSGPEIAAFGAGGSTPDSERFANDEEIQAAIRKRDQAKMVMDYAYANRFEDIKNQEDYDLTADKGEIAWQDFKENEQTQEMQYDEYGNPLGINEFDPYYHTNFADQNENWTEDEKKTFYYLFATNRDNAFAYGNEVNAKYAKAEAEENSWGTREWAQRDFGTGAVTSLLSIPAGLVGGLYDYMNMAAENQGAGGIYTTQYGGWSNWSEDVRGSIGTKLNQYGTLPEGIPVLGGKGLGDAYQLMMSMADSSVAVLAGGGITNLMFFGSAAASATRRALERGIEPDKAVMFGFASGAAEVLGEWISVDKLLSSDLDDYLRTGILKSIAIQGGVEGSEEFFTTLLNTAADYVINGDKRELQQKIEQYAASGMSIEEAKKKAKSEWLEDLCFDAVGGFLSGAGMAGGRIGLNVASASMTPYSGDFQTLMDMAELTDEGSESRRRIDKAKGDFDAYQKALTEAFNKNAKPVETVAAEQTEQATQEPQPAETRTPLPNPNRRQVQLDFSEEGGMAAENGVFQSRTNDGTGYATVKEEDGTYTAYVEGTDGQAVEVGNYTDAGQASYAAVTAIQNGETQQQTPGPRQTVEEQRATTAEVAQEGQNQQEQAADVAQDQATQEQERATPEPKTTPAEQKAGQEEEGEAKTQERTPKPRMPISEFRGRQIEAALKEELSAKDRTVLEEKATARLTDLGVENAGKAASAVVDRVLGSDKGTIGNAVRGLNFNDSRVRIVLQELTEQLAGQKTSASWLGNTELMTVGQNNAWTRTIENGLKQVRVKSSSERSKVTGATMVNGKLNLTIEQDGKPRTLSQDQLELSDSQQRALGLLTRVLGDDAANAYDGMTIGNMGDVLQVMRYASAFGTVRDVLGRAGVNEDAALASPLRKGLTDAQVLRALAAGRKLGPVPEGQRAKSRRGTGAVSLEGGTLDGRKLGGVKNREAVTNSQRYKTIKRLAEELGIDVVLYESDVADDKGNLEDAPHGAYKDGVIWLDWNAGVYNVNKFNNKNGVRDYSSEAEALIFLTMSHELTHFLEQNAEKEYNELRDFITQYMADNDKDFNGMVRRKLAEQSNIDHDEAVREVIADACQTMLVDSKYVEQLINEKPTLWERIRDWIRNFFGFAKAQAKGPEFEAIRDVAAQISEIWDRALQVAVESRLSEETLQETPTIKEQAAAGVLTREQQQAILDEAKSRGVRTDRLADLYRQRETVRNTPSQQTPLMLPAHEYTAKEKAAIKRRFNKAVEELMDSVDGWDLTREQAEQMVREYAAINGGYFSMADEMKQRGMTVKQAAEDRRAWLDAREQEAYDALDDGSQDIFDAFGPDGTIELSDDGEFELAISEDGSTIAYSPRTYQDGGRDKLIKALKDNGHTQDEINDTVNLIDDAMDYLQILAAGYSKNMGYNTLSEHLLANITTYIKSGEVAKQALSTLVNNGDYPINLDLALICKKRVAYMRLMNKLIDDGILDKVNFGGSAIAEVNTILRNNGFETACLGCFVESRRLQLQNWAETIVEEWNAEVDKLTTNAGSFGFAAGTSIVKAEDVAKLVNELEKAGKKNAKGNLNLGKGSVQTKMGRLLKKVPSLRQHLTVADLLNPKGLTALRAYDQNLFSLVKQRYGAASPKIVQDFNPYNSEIADLTFSFVKDLTGNAVKGAQQYISEAKEANPKQKGESTEEYNKRIETLAMQKYLYNIGGARIQSFSDFMIENVFDYLQIFADMSARRLPMHGYTKENTCLRLFGMTGAKWNGSLIAHVEQSMGKEYAGLMPVSEAKGGRGIVVTVDGKQYAICFDDYARHVATGSFIQSIGMKDIIALQLDPRYSRNVGSITIGVSDKQILAMLDSDLFRMVIPYHASGMLPEYAKLVGVDLYNDYTDYQNTRVKACYDLQGNVVEGFKQKDGKPLKIDTSYAYNKEVQRTGDARKAADNYIKWCAERHPVYDGGRLVGYAVFDPKFSNSPFGTDFTKHRNYYKLLEDFNSYDCLTGESALQGAVEMRLPSEETRLTPGQLDAYKQALRDTGLYSEREIEKYAQKAQQTFKEIIADEVKGRAEYESKQAKVWDSTIQQVEDTLLEKYPEAIEERAAQRAKAAAKKAGKAQLSGRTQADRDYLAAVERGDMETAQRMVDDAARAAGYNIKAWHGSRFQFNEFSRAELGKSTGTEASKRWFFAADYDTANSYYPAGVIRDLMKLNPNMYSQKDIDRMEKRGVAGKLYSLYIKMENPLDVDVAGYDYAAHRESADAMVEYLDQAERENRDGIILRNVRDNNLHPSEENSTDYLFKYSEQVKLADPVTYDDDGNVIPLSERFNSSNPDIRYSARDYNSKGEIEAEIDRLQDEIANLYSQEDAFRNDPEYAAAKERLAFAVDFKDKVEARRALRLAKERLGYDDIIARRNEAAEEIKRLKELREQFLKVTPITKAQYDKLAKHFGTTKDYEVAGFILTDGRMLDFSGKKQYGSAYAGGREVYHNEVGDVLNLPTDTSPRIDMVSNGNIRLVPEINGINLSAKPTPQQRAALRGFIEYHNGNVHIDIDNVAGRTIESFGYYNGTSAAKVLADIDNYFDTGATPAPVSDLRAFYSARTGDKSDRELLLDASDASLTDAEQKARAAYKAQVDAYRSRQQAVTTLIDAMDKAVRDGDATAATKLRAKLTAAEKKMAEALAGLTEAERGPELREILRREREIQRRRTDSRIRESYGRRELRQKVDRLWKDLTKRLSSPSEKKNIPVNVMMQAVDVLEAINMDATRADSKAGQKLRDRLNELKSRYNSLKNDPDFRQAAMYDPQVAEFLDNMIETVGDTPINRMSAQQLAAVYNTLKALDHVARGALKVRLRTMEYSAYDLSKRMTEETRSVGKQKAGAIDMYLNAGLSPARMFNRLGGYHKDSTWSQVYEMLNEGQLKQTQLQVEGSMLFEDLLAAKDYGKFVDPKNTVDVGLKDADGKTIEITHGMLVSLYMHLMNEQNRRHVAYGGLTIPGLSDYYNGKKIKGTENAKSAAGVLQEIAEINDRIRETDDPALKEALEAERDAAADKAMSYLEELQKAVEGKLTEYDRKWIAACRELFDGFSKRALNEATMQVYGIKRANVENYFPIWVDGNFLNTPFESVAKDFSLENAGFMKERVDSAKPIRLADVSDVAASQIRKVAQYAGLMPVIHDFNKIWGKTQTGYRDSVRQAVMQTYGQSGVNYIENLMADLNGARGMENSPLGEMLNRLRGHMAQASLTLSLRTAMGQVASYPTAAAVLGWDAIRQGITNYKKVDPELILKWSPLLKYRMQGYRDPELGQIAQMNSKFDRAWKKARWATGWIQAFDGFTVGQLVWSASEAYVQIHDKSLKKGTDAYYEAVAKKFNEAVELTQPNYTTMQRPDILRNPNALVKQLTMFLTQRLQNFNIMYDAAATYSQMKKDRAAGKYGVTNEDVRQAGIRTRTAALSQITAAATIVAFKFLADVILHSMNAYRDDDDELTKESVSAELLDMFLDSLAGNVLGGSELYDLIESKAFGKTYYGIEVSGVSTVTDALKAVNDFYDKVAKGEVSWKDADKLAKKISVIAGIPYANAEKIIRGGIWHVQDMINGEFGSFEAGVDRTTGQQAHRLWRAYDAKDFAQAKKIRDEVGDDDKLNQALAAYIKKQYADGTINKFEAQRQLEKYAGKDKEAAEKTMREYSSEVETGIKFSQIEDSFLLGDITAQKAQQMLVKYGGLDAQTAKMKVDFWSYQNKNPGSKLEFSSYKTYVSKYQGIGLTVAQYESYSERLKDCKGVDADGDGKTDSGSKKAEVVKLIDSLSLTPAQKDQLYYANNYGASGLKDTPWHK